MKAKYLLASGIILAIACAAWFGLQQRSGVELGTGGQSGEAKLAAGGSIPVDSATAVDSPEGLKTALAISDDAERNRLVTKICRQWLDRDRASFIAFLDELEVEELGAGILWRRLHPGLLEAILQVDDAAATSPLLEEVLVRSAAAFAEDDALAAADWVETYLQGDVQDHARAEIAGELAVADPDRAVAMFDAMVQPARRIEAAQAMARAFAEADGVEAIAWTMSLPVTMERNLAMDGVLPIVAASDPEVASKALQDYRRVLDEEAAQAVAKYRDEYASIMNLDPNNEDDITTPEVYASERSAEVDRLTGEAGEEVVRALAEANAAEALRFANAAQGSLRDRLLAAAYSGIAAKDPAAAWSQADSTSARSPAIAKGVFEEWGAADPVEAMTAALAIDDVRVKDAAVEGLATGMVSVDPDAADQLVGLIDKLPSGRGRDAALGVIVDRESVTSPSTALQRALSIQSDAPRREALNLAFASILDQDPGEAARFLAEAPITAKEKRRLERMLGGVLTTSR